MTTPSRPALRYHGGKWRLAPWIIAHFPPHRVYVEPFGGAASVLLRKPRSYAEIYNDLDDEVVNLFRVLRDRQSACQLSALVRLTPFARTEFEAAFLPADDPIEKARRLIVRSFFAGGTRGVLDVDRVNAGFQGCARVRADVPERLHAWDWQTYPGALLEIVERLDGVLIESKPALKLVDATDHGETLFYCDPPYVRGTRMRRANRLYRHELSDDDHTGLLDCLCRIDGMAVVSGYASKLYDERLPDWRRIERRAFADGARARTEVLWINPAAAAALHHGPLFDPSIARVA